MKSLNIKFTPELDRKTWALIQQVTKQSDKVLVDAVKELKARKANKAYNRSK